VSAFEIVVLITALSVSTTLLVLVVAAVWWFDRYDREPLHLVAGVFLWGALVAPVLSVAGSSLIGVALDSPTVFMVGGVGPIIEELTKAFGIVLIVMLSKEFDNPTDGVVYGTASGLGFAVTENALYATVGTGVWQADATLALVLGRTAMSAGVHALASATFGGCLGFAYLSRGRLERASWVFGGMIGAVALHAGWNLLLLRLHTTQAPVQVAAPWFAALPLLYGLYLLTLFAFLRSEQRIIQRQLAEEVELQVVPSWVCEVIPFYRRRIRSEWWPTRRERTVLARLMTRLAFRKHAVERLPQEEADLAGLEVVRLRQRIRAMLGLSEECQGSVEMDDPSA
jgi:RsiW-degrading membrane proteinase PrsW (M82 family)